MKLKKLVFSLFLCATAVVGSVATDLPKGGGISVVRAEEGLLSSLDTKGAVDGFIFREEVLASSQEVASNVFSSSVEVLESLPEPVRVVETFSIPQGYGRFKSYMGYTAITSVGSAQYRLQQSAVTGAYGIRYYDGFPMIAVANRFASCGERLRITFSHGASEVFIVGDIKSGTNFAHPDGSVVEFVVDPSALPAEVQLTGSYDCVYGGTVVSIEKVQ